jgi:diguanylate cyclase (GGDEF)-like protein/PAS domain S-box-containing protein
MRETAVVVVDRLLRVVAVAGRLDVFGAPSGDIVGQSLDELLEGDAWLVWGEPVRGALAGRSTVFEAVASGGRVLAVSVAPLRGCGDVCWAVANCVEEVVECRPIPDAENGASGALYRAVTRNLPDTAVTVFDRDLRFRMAYGEALALNGWTSEETEGRTPRELMPAALADVLEPLFEAALRGQRSTVELLSLHGDRTLWTRVAPVIGAGVPAGVAISVDITERRQAEEASRRLAAIVEQSGDAILAIDRDGTITAWNRGAERLLGYDAADATGQPMMSVVPEERGDEEREVLRQVLDGATISYEGQRLHADRHMIDVSVTASPIANAQGTVIAVSAILRDVTESKLLERRLRHLATHDPLTGLLNRGAFDGELERSVAFARRFESAAALLLVDIDHFKYINDTYGHAVGDAALRRVADILAARLRETDLFARVGGDEFGVILAGTTADDASAVAEELLDAIRSDTSIQLEGNVVRLTASIGLTAIDPAEHVTTEDIVRQADIAMYEAKESGRDRRVESTGATGSEPSSVARLGWAHRVRDALREDHFVLHQQPIVRLSSGHVERAELLIRMRNDHTELIPPGAFLPAAERFRQIGAIDHWVIGRAIEMLRETEAPRILHVNLSGMTISDPKLITELPARIARESGDPTRLAFEITETAAIENIDTATELAQRLSTLGCEIVLDDFGSGFASFYYLKYLPFAVIKIDGEFIKQITTSRVDQVTVRSIVELAHGLEKTTIAECVENEPTLQLVRQLGIDYAQGFHIGRPHDLISKS